MTLTAVSMFSGIGGLDLAATRAGFHVTDMYERDAFCCRVLRSRFPDSQIHEGDIDDVESIPTVDLVFGGPPCQPHSNSGNRAGAADPRHKWPAMYRLVNQARPQCVLVENVRGGLSSGLLDEVGSDLESAGYKVIPLLYPVVLFDAPHERYRLFIVAYRDSQRRLQSQAEQVTAHDTQRDAEAHQPAGRAEFHETVAGGAVVPDAQGSRLPARGQSRPGVLAQSRPGEGRVLGDAASHSQPHESQITGAVQSIGQPLRAGWRNQRKLPQPGMVRVADGSADGLDFPGFPAYFGQPQHDYEPSRTVIRPGAYHRKRIEALGNMVVPQQAEPIFCALYQWMESLS